MFLLQKQQLLVLLLSLLLTVKLPIINRFPTIFWY